MLVDLNASIQGNILHMQSRAMITHFFRLIPLIALSAWACPFLESPEGFLLHLFVVGLMITPAWVPEVLSYSNLRTANLCWAK